MRYRFGVPQHTIIAHYTAMQMIGPIVGSQLIAFTINTELSLGDAVTKTTNECTKKHPVLLIVGQFIKPKGHVGEFSLGIGYFQRHYGAAIIHNAGLNTGTAAEGIDTDLLTRRQLSKGFLLN